MAVANLAVLLARAGHKVLCIDWDLEAPGLDRYMRTGSQSDQLQTPKLASPHSRGGLLAVLQQSTVGKLAPWRDYVHVRSGPDGTVVHLIGSGDDADDYTRRLSEFSWSEYFAVNNGGDIIEALRSEWKSAYDYILIDSRTGLTDASGICTIQMPDLLFMLFGASEQGVHWSGRIARSIREGRRLLVYDRAFLMIVPVLSRFDAREESDRASAAMDRIAALFEPYFADWLPRSIKVRDMLAWSILPYVPRYSFEEALAVEDEPEAGAQGLSFYYQLFARLILARFQGVRKILAGFGVPGAELPSLLPDVSVLVSELRSDGGALARYRTVIAQRAEDEPVDAAEALEILATCLVSLSRPRDATELLKEAEQLLLRAGLNLGVEVSRMASLRAELLLKAADTVESGTREERIAVSFAEQEKTAIRLADEGRLDEAEGLLRRSYDLALTKGDLLTAARSAYRLSRILEQQGRFEAALVMLRRGLELFTKAGDTVGQALTLNHLGSVLQRLGKLDEAAEVLSKAYELSDRHGDERAQVFALTSLGGVLKRLGRREEAASVLRRGYESATRYHDTRAQAMIAHSLGSVLLELGRLDEAVDVARRGYDVLSGHEDPNLQAMLLNGLGRLLLRAGRLQEARDVLLRGYEDLVRVVMAKDHTLVAPDEGYGVALVLSRIGTVLQRLGQLDESVDILKRGLELLEHIRSERGQTLVMKRLAASLKRLGQFDEASLVLRSMLEMLVLQGDTPGYVDALRELGEVLRRNNIAESEKVLRESITVSETSGDERRVIISRIELGRTLLDLGNLNEAVDQLRLAFEASVVRHNASGILSSARLLVRTLRRMEAKNEAADILNRAIAAAPSSKALERLKD